MVLIYVCRTVFYLFEVRNIILIIVVIDAQRMPIRRKIKTKTAKVFIGACLHYKDSDWLFYENTSKQSSVLRASPHIFVLSLG